MSHAICHRSLLVEGPFEGARGRSDGSFDSRLDRRRRRDFISRSPLLLLAPSHALSKEGERDLRAAREIIAAF